MTQNSFFVTSSSAWRQTRFSLQVKSFSQHLTLRRPVRIFTVPFSPNRYPSPWMRRCLQEARKRRQFEPNTRTDIQSGDAVACLFRLNVIALMVVTCSYAREFMRHLCNQTDVFTGGKSSDDFALSVSGRWSFRNDGEEVRPRNERVRCVWMCRSYSACGTCKWFGWKAGEVLWE